MQLTRLDLADVRAIREARLAPAPGINLLLGDNGAGKSSVLEAIHLFSGEASTRDEPPAALLVLDATKEHLPQLLCSRADLSLLYAQLEV